VLHELWRFPADFEVHGGTNLLDSPMPLGNIDKRLRFGNGNSDRTAFRCLFGRLRERISHFVPLILCVPKARFILLYKRFNVCGAVSGRTEQERAESMNSEVVEVGNFPPSIKAFGALSFNLDEILPKYPLVVFSQKHIVWFKRWPDRRKALRSVKFTNLSIVWLHVTSYPKLNPISRCLADIFDYVLRLKDWFCCIKICVAAIWMFIGQNREISALLRDHSIARNINLSPGAVTLTPFKRSVSPESQAILNGMGAVRLSSVIQSLPCELNLIAGVAGQAGGKQSENSSANGEPNGSDAHSLSPLRNLNFYWSIATIGLAAFILLTVFGGEWVWTHIENRRTTRKSKKS
jgi:hypothetical protein